MSEGEVFIFVSSAIAGAVAWALWYYPLLTVQRLGAGTWGSLLPAVAPPLCGAALLYLLRTAAAHDVRDDSKYLILYFLLGMAWVGVAAHFLPYLGVSWRDDVMERGNGAAATAIAGALLGLTCCYAGGNIGDGPGWEVVVFAAGLATSGLAFAWLLLELLASVSERVTIERDRAAGWRLAAVLAACGLVLGRAVAGDWVSVGATLRDFVALAWPVLPLVAVAAALERALRPTVERPAPPVALYGLPPAALYVLTALWYVARLGRPS